MFLLIDIWVGIRITILLLFIEQAYANYNYKFVYKHNQIIECLKYRSKAQIQHELLLFNPLRSYVYSQPPKHVMYKLNATAKGLK